MYIACGVDSDKTTVYIQSENEYIPAISWILECNTYYGEASRMIQNLQDSYVKSQTSIGVPREQAIIDFENKLITQAQEKTTMVNVGPNQNRYYKPRERIINLDGGK